jgi:hypothetical protein
MANSLAQKEIDGGFQVKLSLDKLSVVETVQTEFGARNMAPDPKTHQVFIDTADLAPAPQATTEQPKPQPTSVSGTFRLLVYGRSGDARC